MSVNLHVSYKKGDTPLWITPEPQRHACFAAWQIYMNERRVPQDIESMKLGVALDNISSRHQVKLYSRFAHYYAQTKGGQFTTMSLSPTRLEVWCPENINYGVASAILAPVRNMDETPSNMTTFINLCQKGVHPDIAMAMAMQFRCDDLMETEKPKGPFRDANGRFTSKPDTVIAEWPTLRKGGLIGHSVVPLNYMWEESLKQWFSPEFPDLVEEAIPSVTNGRRQIGEYFIWTRKNRYGFKSFYIGAVKPTGAMRHEVFTRFPLIAGFRSMREGIGFSQYKEILQYLYSLSSYEPPKELQ